MARGFVRPERDREGGPPAPLRRLDHRTRVVPAEPAA